MPYIPQIDREFLDDLGTPGTPGQLNYKLTIMIHKYLQNSGPMSYSAINEVIGVLECAKLELYRQIASPYEDKKKRENGPISTLDIGDGDVKEPSSPESDISSIRSGLVPSMPPPGGGVAGTRHSIPVQELQPDATRDGKYNSCDGKRCRCSTCRMFNRPVPQSLREEE